LALDRLLVFRDQALACTGCGLSATRTNVVYGVGCTDKPGIAFVGEAPGENEDLQAEPFVGKAGRLLNRYIEWMQLTRDHVYITNLVKCRPPRNRTPLPAEASACYDHLCNELGEVQPRVIIALGGSAATFLLHSDDGVAALRGRWHEWGGIPVRVTYHPAYLLRDPSKCKDFEVDLSHALARSWLK
jgi:uracil-DNA glycosylase